MSISLMKHQPRKPVASVSSDSSPDSFDLATRIERWPSALTTTELADVVHLSPKQIYALAAKRLIPSYRIRGSIRFDPHRVAEWLRSKAA